VESQGKRPEDRKTQNSGGGKPGPVELQPKILAPAKKDQGPAEYTGGPRKQPEDGKFGRGNDREPRNRDDERYEARNRREQPSSSFKGGYNDSYAEKGRQKDRKRGQDDYYEEYDDNLGYEDEGRGYEDDYYEGDGGYGQDDYYEEYEPHDKNGYYPSEKSSYNRNYGQGSDRKGYDNYDKPSYDDQRGKGNNGQNAKKNFEGGFQEKPGTETGKKVFYQRVDGPQDDTASRKSDVSKRTDTSSYYDIEDDLGFERNNDKWANNRGDRAKDNGYGRGKGGSEYVQSRPTNSGGHQAQGKGRGREDQRDRGRNNFEQRAPERVEDGFKKSRGSGAEAGQTACEEADALRTDSGFVPEERGEARCGSQTEPSQSFRSRMRAQRCTTTSTTRSSALVVSSEGKTIAEVPQSYSWLLRNPVSQAPSLTRLVVESRRQEKVPCGLIRSVAYLRSTHLPGYFHEAAVHLQGDFGGWPCVFSRLSKKIPELGLL
jgi:hypothetical protein